MNDVVVSLLLLGALSGGEQLPFWVTANSYGLMPEDGAGMMVAELRKDFDPAASFQWRAGASAALVASGTDGATLLPDQLYVGGRWKTLRLDAGMMHRERDFVCRAPMLGSLSLTEGHMLENNNSRTMPGILASLEPTAVPYTGGKLKLSGAFGDYKTMDDRYVPGTLVHRTKAFVSYDASPSLQFKLGIDHFAQWGGVHPLEGAMKVNLANYLRVITGRSAAEEGTLSDRMNVLGNQGGTEMFGVRWASKGAGTFRFLLEKPYEDKSGMKLWNFPDGNYTLGWESGRNNVWVSMVVLEYQYTKWQSGPIHDPETDEEGNPIPWRPGLNYNGMDNYFNNGYYRSGWTHYGRCMGNPLFTVGDCGIINNRVRAAHLGLGGCLFRNEGFPYKLMLTYSQNYGTYNSPLEGESSRGVDWKWWQKEPSAVAVPQFSASFTGLVANIFGVCGLNALYGLYLDKGRLLGDAFALTLGISYSLGCGK